MFQQVCQLISFFLISSFLFPLKRKEINGKTGAGSQILQFRKRYLIIFFSFSVYSRAVFVLIAPFEDIELER